MLRGKKGAVEEMIYVLVVVFFLAVSLVVVVFVNDKMSDVIKTTALNDTNVSSDITSKMDLINEKTVDRTFVFIAGALMLSMIITAFLARTHPVWFFIWVIVIAIALFSAAPLANAYQKIIEAPAIASSVAGSQEAMNYFMQHLVKFMLGTALVSLVIALAKPESVQAIGGGADI
jgi:hypothetical protein